MLRSTGLEAWFQRAPAADHAGQQERVFLLLTLPEDTPRHTVLLAEVLREHQPLIEVGGGHIGSYRGGRLLLSWPVAAGCHRARAVVTYFQLSDALGSPGLHGAASLGWVASAGATKPYRGPVLKQIAGMLHESQRQASGLLVSAALHYQLDAVTTLRYELDVAFKVPGHRYPATVYRAATTPNA